MMPTGIHFPLDERQPLALREYVSLEDYQSAVGGDIEAIDAGVKDLSFFANDEAKLIGLAINRRATLFWWLHLPPARHHDFLSGDVVLVGPTDAHGATLGVPPSIQTLLFTPSTYQVEITATGMDEWHRIEPTFDDYFKAAALAVSLEQQWSHVSGIRIVTST